MMACRGMASVNVILYESGASVVAFVNLMISGGCS
jgi:hypothetical protein